MYQYNEFDRQLVKERVDQFRDQTQRFLDGNLSEGEFLPLRLQNGLYIQRMAPLLRIAIPYGTLSATQLRTLADVSRKYDKGYGHISTRQNFQLNWPALEDVPDILAELAEVEMHAIQTSGSCIRSITADPFSGVATDEIEDARPYAEILRQWSTLHPEFAFLPRKFKIAVCGSENDRTAVHFHDIGVIMAKNEQGETGFEILVGGGLGRTPVIGTSIRKFLPKQHLLTYVEAILRIYNQLGRRDNKCKARIKILVRALGADTFAEMVEEEWQHLKDSPSTLTDNEISRVCAFFEEPDYNSKVNTSEPSQLTENKEFSRWYTNNTRSHKQPGYRSVVISLKGTGTPPGDVSDTQMELIADLAEKFSFSELRTSREQNLILPYVEKAQLFEIWQALGGSGMATANIGTINDITCCPGGDYCSLANAKSIPIAEEIQRIFEAPDTLDELGDIDLKVSGCMNACGHHHIGQIGILGVDKKGKEFYQVSLGGGVGDNAAVAKILGPSFSQAEVPGVIKQITDIYLDKKTPDEKFTDTLARIGVQPFKEKIYAKTH
ncbi:MAG: nitrite/sulfite reductase [Pseudomonadales bacterium]|nr:nitrite/sulfite reductase [Pseudomonadales bacterium]